MEVKTTYLTLTLNKHYNQQVADLNFLSQNNTIIFAIKTYSEYKSSRPEIERGSKERRAYLGLGQPH